MDSTGDNPYVGPRTFVEAERDRFFGREGEARELVSLIISERLTLFHAQSGAGKSSLINTRILPKLIEDEGFEALPVGRVSGELPPGVDDVDNIFAFNLMLSLEQSQDEPSRFARLTLPHFFSRLVTEDGKTYSYDETSTGEDKYKLLQPPHILVIDQFEEIVTSHLGRWPERVEFFRQLNEVLSGEPNLRVVLIIRDDHIAALSPYSRLVMDGMRARFHMQRMKEQAALKAIEKPALLGGREFAPDVARKLLNNLRQIRTMDYEKNVLGEFVEPVQMQVVCYQLWENLRGQSSSVISEQDLETVGNVDKALSQFYELAIEKTVNQTNVSEITLRKWFSSTLITKAETRGIVYQGPHETEGISNEVVHFLANQYLLRSETRAGGRWFELVHDRFIEPILTANREWRENLNPLTRAALQWTESNKESSLLYTGDQLKEALRSSEGEVLEENVQAFLDESVKIEEERNLRKRGETFRKITIALVVASFLFISLAIYAFRQSNIATENANLALTRESEAVDSAAIAATNQLLANDAAGAAATSQKEAEAAEATAVTLRIAAEASEIEARDSEQTAVALRDEAILAERTASALRSIAETSEAQSVLNADIAETSQAVAEVSALQLANEKATTEAQATESGLLIDRLQEAGVQPATVFAQATRDQACIDDISKCPPTPTPVVAVGNILYTFYDPDSISGNSGQILTTHTEFTVSQTVVGDFFGGTDTCGSVAQITDGSRYPLSRGGRFCGTAQGPNVCASPDNSKELVLNVSVGTPNSTINVRNMGEEGNGRNLYTGSISSNTVYWSPTSNHFVFVDLDNFLIFADINGNLPRIDSPVLSPSFSFDGSMILYQKFNDIWIYVIETDERRNLTNSSSLSKACPAWYYGP